MRHRLYVDDGFLGPWLPTCIFILVHILAHRGIVLKGIWGGGERFCLVWELSD